MRASLLAAFLVAPCIASAVPKKPKPAVTAVPASPSSGKAKRGGLIDSDLGGRDLAFLANALEVGQAQRFLAAQAERTANPDLRGFGEDLVKTLAAQSTVLKAVADMRKIRISEGQSDTERRIAIKLADLDGIRLEKALLDQFREVDRRALATYELGSTSNDATIRKLCEQTLPQIRGHLTFVDAMAGIAPKREPAATERPVPLAATVPEPGLAPVATPPPRPGFRASVAPVAAPPPPPGFRASVHLPSESAQTTGR